MNKMNKNDEDWPSKKAEALIFAVFFIITTIVLRIIFG